MTEETTSTRRPVAPLHAGPAGGDPADAGRGDALDAARRTLERSRALRERVAGVLGSLSIRDAQNAGGQ